MSVQIQLRRDSAADFTSANPTLAEGEVGIETDTLRFKIGDGSTAWNSLRYVGANIPQRSISASESLVWADQGKQLLHPAADNNARTFTIPANSSVAYPIGTVLHFVNEINTLTIAITTDTLVLAGAGTTGSRTLAANGIATAEKVTSTKWYIAGSGLT